MDNICLYYEYTISGKLVRQMDHTQCDKFSSQSPNPIIGQLAKPENISKFQATSITHQRTQPCDYVGNPMNILGKFDGEIEGNQLIVRSAVYVTGEGNDNLLSFETAKQLG